MNPLIYVLVSVLLVTVSQLSFKYGITRVRQYRAGGEFSSVSIFFRKYAQPTFFLGFLLNGIAGFFWLLAYSELDLTLVFPFVSLNLILVPLGAVLVFREKVTFHRRIGISIICAGVLFVALSGTWG